MKKLFTALVLAILLAGCATSANESFLDEKIKCKKLADERIEKLKDEYSSSNASSVELAQFTFYEPKSTCIIEYVVTPWGETNSASRRIIEDILSGKNIASFGGIGLKYWPDEEEKAEMWVKENQEFQKKHNLYFGEDAE